MHLTLSDSLIKSFFLEKIRPDKNFDVCSQAWSAVTNLSLLLSVAGVRRAMIDVQGPGRPEHD